MTLSVENNSGSLNYASLATGVACGAVVGYTISATGDLLTNALIATSCGISRAAYNIFFEKPLTKQYVTKYNKLLLETDKQKASEVNALLTKMNILNIFYRANLGFGFGLALGTGGSASSLVPAILSGILIHAAGFLAEALPTAILSEPINLKFDENGNQII